MAPTWAVPGLLTVINPELLYGNIPFFQFLIRFASGLYSLAVFSQHFLGT